MATYHYVAMDGREGDHEWLGVEMEELVMICLKLLPKDFPKVDEIKQQKNLSDNKQVIGW
jgi:hypothetical protein